MKYFFFFSKIMLVTNVTVWGTACVVVPYSLEPILNIFPLVGITNFSGKFSDIRQNA